MSRPRFPQHIPEDVVHGGTGVEPVRHSVGSRTDPGEGGKVALVTGAAGFIGRHLTLRLATVGWSVRALDLASRPGWVDEAGVEYHQLDVREDDALERVLKGVAVVFHLASAHLEVRAPAEWYRSVNVSAVEGLVRASARAGVQRMVHTSTVGIYGHVESPPANEQSPVSPTNPYERTKLEGEEAATRVAAERGLDLVILRPGWVYGPGCPRTAKLLRAVSRRRFFYAGDGSNLRHPIFISDTLEGFLAAAAAPEDAMGRPYLIVGPRPVTVRELVETCARVQDVPPPGWVLPKPMVQAGLWTVEMGFRAMGREPPVSRRSLAFFENDNAFDGARAEAELGFRPVVDLEEGLRTTVEAITGDPAVQRG